MASPWSRPKPRPVRRVYGDDVIEALRFVWAVLDAPTGKRLAPFMDEALEALERHGELTLCLVTALRSAIESPTTLSSTPRVVATGWRSIDIPR